jgi:hypothetical protein
MRIIKISIVRKIVLLLILFPFQFFAQTYDTLETKQQAKYKARFIHPKAKYLAFSGGSSYMNTFINDQNNFLNRNNQTSNSNVFSVFYEHGVKKKYFAELGYSLFETGITLNLSNNNVGSGSYVGVAINHQFQLGVGYRIITPKRMHLLNLHGGIFMGFLNQKLNDDFKSMTFSGVDPLTSTSFDYRFINKRTEQLSFGTYLGVSKELRLSKDVRFFIKYTQQLGFNTVFAGEIDFLSTAIPFNYTPTYRVRNSGGLLSFGLKIQLLKKKLIHNE